MRANGHAGATDGLSVVYFSPFTMLYWYDRPEQDAGRPELEFFRHVFTTWDETRVVDGQIGQFAVVARRKGNQWFAGAITNDRLRSVHLPLTFLSAGQHYIAHIYTDADSPTDKAHDVAIATRTCTASDSLQLPLHANGGALIWFEPAER